jgi:hypothetical protein
MRTSLARQTGPMIFRSTNWGSGDTDKEAGELLETEL